MDAGRVYALLKQALRLLEEAEEHAIAAYVGHGMALVEARYGVNPDEADRPAD